MKAEFRNHLLLEEAAKIMLEVDIDKKYKKEEEKRFKILKVRKTVCLHQIKQFFFLCH